MGDEFELFNPSDFESIRLTFDFKNLSTDRAVPNSSDVSLLEVGDKTLTVEIPFDNCAVDNHVLLKIFKTDPESGNQVPIFNTTAKMIKIDKVGDGDRLLIVLDLIQFDKKGWNDFLCVFSSRQQEISRLFEMRNK